jgi:hypothetical protein
MASQTRRGITKVAPDAERTALLTEGETRARAPSTNDAACERAAHLLVSTSQAIICLPIIAVAHRNDAET